MNGLRCDVETCPRETWCPSTQGLCSTRLSEDLHEKSCSLFYDFKEDLKTNKKDTNGSTEGKKRGHEDRAETSGETAQHRHQGSELHSPQCTLLQRPACSPCSLACGSAAPDVGPAAGIRHQSFGR
ncbi:hypothetical protein KUCAC02_037451 [Chaenocephalus aceratus]|nr:hypothetical protein KUCAC02_037451 [Chaenocephalus aceratus]